MQRFLSCINREKAESYAASLHILLCLQRRKCIVGTYVTDPAQFICLEADTRTILATTLQPWLVSSPVLTLVLLAGAAASTYKNNDLRDLGSTLDEIEQMAVGCVRRTDVVVRCDVHCCAVVLLGAEREGALCVVNRLRRRLEGCDTARYPLLVGLAAAPEQATEPDALIRLACLTSACLIPPKEGGNVPWDVAGSLELPDVLTLPQTSDDSGESSRVIRLLDAGEQSNHEQAMTVNHRKLSRGSRESLQAAPFARARARALGIPYLDPPQRIPNRLRNLLSKDVMQQLQCFPVGRERNSLTVALADPTDRGVLRQLEQITGMNIFPVMTDPEVFKALAQPGRSRHASK
jgi:hypothetical protein